MYMTIAMPRYCAPIFACEQFVSGSRLVVITSSLHDAPETQRFFCGYAE